MNVGVMKDYKLRDLRASHTHCVCVTAKNFFFQGRMAGMFFPLCSEAQQLTTVQQPASLVLAGESSTIKTALLLQYAYNAALRGEKLQVAVLAR